MSQLDNLIKEYCNEKLIKAIEKHTPRYQDYHDGEYREEGHDGKTFCRGFGCQRVEFVHRVLQAIKNEIKQ